MLLKDMYNALPILNENAETISLNEHISLCYESIDEDLRSKSVYLEESAKLTQEYLIETLDNIKTFLLGVYDKVLQMVTAYILNSVSVLKKLRPKLLNISKDKLSAVSYATYEYPKLDKLPIPVKRVISPTKVENDFLQIIDPLKFDKSKYSREVDREIDKFASEVLDCRVRVGGNLSDTIRDISYREMQGKKLTQTLSVDRLDEMINDILNYKELKLSIQETRAELIAYYEELKSSMKHVYGTKEENRSLRSMYRPELGELDSSTARNISFGRIEMDRLFNSYMRIYREVFKVKLDIFHDRIELNRRVINELIKISYMSNKGDITLVY